MHGVNPLVLVMLTNMGDFGAEVSASEIYHQWFGPGTKWLNPAAGVGPAPGFLVGGPTDQYSGSINFLQISP